MMFAVDPVPTSNIVPILAAIISGLGSSLVTFAIAWYKRRGQLHADIKLIRDQVYPNGGSSLRDVVNRIEVQQLVDGELRRAYQQHVNVPFWEADPEGRILWCNGAFAKLLGVSTEDLKDYGWLSMVANDDIARVKHDILASGSHDHHVDYHVHVSGVVHLLNIKTRWRRVTNHEGETVRYVGTVIGSEQVRAEKGGKDK